MKIVLDTGQEIPLELDYISQTEGIQQARVGDDLVFVQVLQGWFEKPVTECPGILILNPSLYHL